MYVHRILIILFSMCVCVLQMNPPIYIPLVEVIPSVHTSQEVVQRTTDLMIDINWDVTNSGEERTQQSFCIQAAECHHHESMEISRGEYENVKQSIVILNTKQGARPNLLCTL